MNRFSLRHKFETSGELPILLEDQNVWYTPQIDKENPKDVTMSPVGLGHTRISTGYA